MDTEPKDDGLKTDSVSQTTQKPRSKQDFFEGILGFSHSLSFEEVLVDKLKPKLDPRVIEEYRELLNKQGILINPENCPRNFNFEEFTDKDWEKIRASLTPILTLYSINNFYSNKRLYDRKPYHRDLDKTTDEIELRSLPLVHGTTREALEKVLETGRVLTNKEIYKSSKEDPEDFHSSGIGATTLIDRELGLDQFVFTDFGRPHMYREQQPEIILVIDPELMNQPGAFVTERDIADCDSLEQYMEGVTTFDNFYEIALQKINSTPIESGWNPSGYGMSTGYTYWNTVKKFSQGQDSEPNNVGTPSFSTWEVKLPEVKVSAIKRIVVRDRKTYDELRAKYGDKIEFLHVPRFEHNNYNPLRIPGEVQRQFAKKFDINFEERKKALDDLSEDEKETEVLVFSVNGYINPLISERTNPDLLPSISYETLEDVVDDIQNTPQQPSALPTVSRNPNSKDRDMSSKHGKNFWFLDFHSRFIKAQFVLAYIEKSKKDPNVSRIVRLSSINPSEVKVDL
ncbi:MAG: hypothetical protein AABX29_02440 [Nanoarchaeota archaeon]